MSLNRNFQAVIFSVFVAISLSGCCGPCFAPCNPFHKDKAPAKEQPLPEKVQNVLQSIGMIFIFGLLVFANGMDVIRGFFH